MQRLLRAGASGWGTIGPHGPHSIRPEESLMTTLTLDEVAARAEAQPGYARPAAYAVGLASYSLDTTGGAHDGPAPAGGEPSASAKPLDTWFPMVNLQEHYRVA